MKKIKIAINGFGRIGRSAARIILNSSDLELVAINDISNLEDIYYYLKYDSLYKSLNHKVSLCNNSLIVDKKKIELFCKSDPKELDLSHLDVDVLLECSGKFLSSNLLKTHIEKGVKRVIISAPPIDNTKMYIMYHNHKEYKGEKIISNASCSANAIVPIFDIVDRYFGIKRAYITTIHSYTTSESLHDTKLSRSAALNMIPVNSSAAKTTAKFFPHLKDKLFAKSVRVPTPTVTIYDLNIQTTLNISKNRLHDVVKDNLFPIFNISDDALVSSDFIKDPFSATLDLNLTQVADENLIKIMLWQDNEFGYAKRLVELAKYVGKSI